MERDNLLSNGKLESVAAHCWMMGMMAILLSPKLKHPVNLERVLKIILVHDLAEAKVGDMPLYKTALNPALKTAKKKSEQNAMREIQSLLPEVEGAEVVALWCEYEANQTPEAKFVKSIDKLEAIIQANAYHDITYWGRLYDDIYYTDVIEGHRDNFHRHEPILMEISEALKALTEKRMLAAGLAPQKYRMKKMKTKRNPVGSV